MAEEALNKAKEKYAGWKDKQTIFQLFVIIKPKLDKTEMLVLIFKLCHIFVYCTTQLLMKLETLCKK